MLENAVDAAFLAAILVAGLSLTVSAAGWVGARALVWVAGLLSLAAVGAWAAFASEPSRELGIPAAGISAAVLGQLGAVALARATSRARAVDAEVTRARAELRSLVEAESGRISEELRRTLARMRADSLSLLAEEERRIAEERRAEIVEREREAGASLVEALTQVERRVEQRLAGWADDLERAQRVLEGQLGRLEQRQRQLIAEAEAKIEAEADQLVSTSEEQRASVLRLREELEQAAQSAVSEALDELQAHTTERRRVIEEIAERIQRRERALVEEVERHEGEAAQRIQMAFADVERRQVEKLERTIEREAARFAEAAAIQFEGILKESREEAAGRFARELDRAIETYVRQADQLFAERLEGRLHDLQRRIDDLAGAASRRAG